MSQKGFVGILIVIIFAILLVGGGAFYLGRLSIPKSIPQSKVTTLDNSNLSELNNFPKSVSTQPIISESKSLDTNSKLSETNNWTTIQAGWIKELKYPLDKYSVLTPDTTYIGILNNREELLFQPVGVTLRPNDQYIKQNLDSSPRLLSLFVINNKENLTLAEAKLLWEKYSYISPGWQGFEKAVKVSDKVIDGIKGIKLDVDCNGEGCFPGSEIFVIKQLPSNTGTTSSVIFRITIIPSLKDDDKNSQVVEEILTNLKFGP